MDANPRIRRITLIPYEGPDDELRRYRLARMDEIALATPPERSSPEPRANHLTRSRAAGANSGDDDGPSRALG